MSSEDLTSEQSQGGTENDELPPKKIRQNFVSETGPLMILSLFLLLLAFFILLVSTSKIDDSKRKAVFNSIAATFVTNRPIQDTYEVAVSRISDFLDDDLIELHKKLWLALVPLALVNVQEAGSVMELIVHSNDLFAPGTADLKTSTQLLIRRIVSSTKTPGQSLRSTLVFQVDDISNIDTALALKQYHGSEGNIVEFYDERNLNDLLDPLRYFDDLQIRSDGNFVVTTNSDTLQFMRAMTMAHALEQAGANPEIMRVGIREKVGQTIQITYEFFSEYSDDNAAAQSGPGISENDD